MTLRPHQTTGLDRLKTAYGGGINRAVIQMATGTGKTPMFAKAKDHLGFTGKVLALAHREELISQAAHKIHTWNPNSSVGIEMAAQKSNGEDFIVASVATLGRKDSKRLAKFDPDLYDLIICDECHHATATSYRRIFEHFDVFNDQRPLLFGVTATVNRADGEALGDVFQEIVHNYGILQAIRDGWLVNLRGFRVRTGINLDHIHTIAGDLAQDELGSTVNTPYRNEIAVRAWLDYGQDRQTVAYTVDIAHAQSLAATFREHGIVAEAVWGVDPDRVEKLKRHREGVIKVLVNCQLLTEGYDDWRIGCVMLVRPTKSEGLYTQIIGRGTRIPDGIGNLLEAKKKGLEIPKTDCIIIDVVDASKRHSLVTLASLFGLNQAADLRGRTITEIVDEVEQIQKERPYVDVSVVEDINNLKTYAEEIDLFKIGYPPEIIQISELKWLKHGEDAYVLMLAKNENVVVLKDILDKWHVVGTVNGYELRSTHQDLSTAIQEADYKVYLLGGKSNKTLVKRGRSEPPTEDQIILCGLWDLTIPPGATKDEVEHALTEKANQSEYAKKYHDILGHE